MKKHFARAVLAAALLCGTAGAAMVVTTTTAMAEEHVSRDVGVPLNDAVKAIQAKDYKTAQAKIAAADAVKDKSDYDKFKINQVKGFLAIQQQDYAAATAAYEAIVASPVFKDLKDPEKKSTLHNALLLSGQSKHWPLVIADAKQLETLKAMDDKTYTVLAQAYYFTNDYANAQTAAQQAVALSKAAGQRPSKAALEIIMSAQAKSKDQAGAVKTMEQLALNYGGANNWAQLVDNALATKGIRNRDAIYLYRLLFFSNAKAASGDYGDAASIALRMGYPVEAKAILEKGLASGMSHSRRERNLMSQARNGARLDKSGLRGIEREAERSKYGTKDILLAEDYWGYGRYADAAAAAKRGLSKGHLRDTGEGNFILGISLVATGKYAEAQDTLAKVDGSTARAEAAHLWSLYAQYKSKTAAAAAPAPAPTQ